MGPSLAEALRAQVQRFQERSGIAGEFSVRGEVPPLPSEVQLQVASIVGQALWNVQQHAGARHVRVVLRWNGRRGEVTVEDDGRGLWADAAARGASGGFGLRSMEERAARLGGRLTLEASPGGGTALRFTWRMRKGRWPWPRSG